MIHNFFSFKISNDNTKHTDCKRKNTCTVVARQKMYDYVKLDVCGYLIEKLLQVTVAQICDYVLI